MHGLSEAGKFHARRTVMRKVRVCNTSSGAVPVGKMSSWWRHQMKTFSALPALCGGEIPPQRPVTRSFYVFFHLCVNKRLNKQSWDWWFETQSYSLWRHCNVIILQGLFTRMFMAICGTEKIQIYVSSSYTTWLIKYPLLNGDHNVYLVANKIPFHLP